MRATISNLPARQTQGPFDFPLTSFKEALEYATAFANSDFAGAYKGRPNDIMVIWQMGAELGIGKAQSLRTFGCIGGKGFAYGDGKFALVVKHPEFEDAKEWFEGKLEDKTLIAYCTIKRKGREPVTRYYTIADAIAAKLWDKDNWRSNQRRMLQHRARGYAVNDTFPDAFYGVPSQYEVEDMIDVTPVVEPPKPQNKGMKGLEESLGIVQAETVIEGEIATEESTIKYSTDAEEKEALLTELNTIIIEKNISQRVRDRWCNQFNVSVIDDIPVENLKKTIKYLKEKK